MIQNRCIYTKKNQKKQTNMQIKYTQFTMKQNYDNNIIP